MDVIVLCSEKRHTHTQNNCFELSGHTSALLVLHKKQVRFFTNILIGIPIVVFFSREKNEAVLTSSFINFEERKSAALAFAPTVSRKEEIMMSN